MQPLRQPRRTKTQLGRANGETALIELSSLPAKNNGIPIQRELFRKQRIETIKSRLSQFKPRFVVFYSPNPQYRAAWNEISGVALEGDKPVLIDRTAAVVTYHPNGEWSKAYWTSIGAELRSLTG